MFCVKEYYKDTREFIGCTFYFENQEAIKLAEKICNKYRNIEAYVSEIDYTEEGYIFEIKVWCDKQ